MPNHKSAEKRQRQGEKRRVRNRLVKTAMRTAVKRVRAAAEDGSPNPAQQLVQAEKTLASAASKGVLHKKTAARRVSRLARLVQRQRAAAAQ